LGQAQLVNEKYIITKECVRQGDFLHFFREIHICK